MSNSKLQVILLADEWKSSKGGLSTLNRELAIQLAKHPNVSVTFLVLAYDEDDLEESSNCNVSIVKAKERVGYKPADWLSFPPKDLHMDIIIGHGVKLGKQAQVIKESHQCKWVQVVHTVPEELSTLKTYSGCDKAISRGDKKQNDEIELCRIADQVVAVGPRLWEFYSRRLTSSGRHVFKLTPGIFSELSSLKLSTEEYKRFDVLLFGRGDPEDFELKGYDIAAKAIAALKNANYHLIFVGAQMGNEDQVKEKLLEYGLNKKQLTVKPFLGKRKDLATMLSAADLAIVPSRSEGFGLTALEALSAGRPFLVTQSSGFGEALQDVLPQGTPWIIDSEESDEWAEAIKSVREKGREAAIAECRTLRERYGKEYSWESQCSDLVEMMVGLANASGDKVKPSVAASSQGWNEASQADETLENGVGKEQSDASSKSEQCRKLPANGPENLLGVTEVTTTPSKSSKEATNEATENKVGAEHPKPATPPSAGSKEVMPSFRERNSLSGERQSESTLQAKLNNSLHHFEAATRPRELKEGTILEHSLDARTGGSSITRDKANTVTTSDQGAGSQEIFHPSIGKNLVKRPSKSNMLTKQERSLYPYEALTGLRKDKDEHTSVNLLGDTTRSRSISRDRENTAIGSDPGARSKEIIPPQIGETTELAILGCSVPHESMEEVEKFFQDILPGLHLSQNPLVDRNSSIDTVKEYLMNYRFKFSVLVVDGDTVRDGRDNERSEEIQRLVRLAVDKVDEKVVVFVFNRQPRMGGDTCKDFIERISKIEETFVVRLSNGKLNLELSEIVKFLREQRSSTSISKGPQELPGSVDSNFTFLPDRRYCPQCSSSEGKRIHGKGAENTQQLVLTTQYGVKTPAVVLLRGIARYGMISLRLGDLQIWDPEFKVSDDFERCLFEKCRAIPAIGVIILKLTDGEVEHYTDLKVKEFPMENEISRLQSNEKLVLKTRVRNGEVSFYHKDVLFKYGNVSVPQLILDDLKKKKAQGDLFITLDESHEFHVFVKERMLKIKRLLFTKM